MSSVDKVLGVLTQLQGSIHGNKKWKLDNISFNEEGAPPSITWSKNDDSGSRLRVMPKIGMNSYHFVVAEESIHGADELVKFNARSAIRKPLEIYSKAYEFATDIIDESLSVDDEKKVPVNENKEKEEVSDKIGGFKQTK